MLYSASAYSLVNSFICEDVSIDLYCIFSFRLNKNLVDEAAAGTRRRFFAVLHMPPVDSPVAAVRVSIVADAKKARN